MERHWRQTVVLVPDDQDKPDVEQTGSIIWNYYEIEFAQSKWGCAKNAMSTFCDSVFAYCSMFFKFGDC
jgi:hypothetical protein